ncbi:MAG: YjjG family noncanonical pyrimidine nucleotidase [Chitinophagaceae bacterium]|nr:YjjG family noncanonical pyrimidine nucleotidase [Chitinophagaceae bacterium]MCW5925595.1 YjjG family noncanonical pyrimidine nucleotidase [Chitinophagaceae bacterium]
MKYRHIFFDLDHTLWDFESNAKLTLQELHANLKLSEYGIHDFNLFFDRYNQHNDKLWDRYRKGFIRRDELRLKRMRLTLLDFKIADEALAKTMDTQFLDMLPTRTILFPHAKEILDHLLTKGYHLHLITNGFEVVQHNKLKYSGLTGYFKQVITSEASNSLKPHKEIFEYAFDKTGAQPHHSIMIGDDIEADINGAKNAGIDQVFVNHKNNPATVDATHTVHSLKELENIL